MLLKAYVALTNFLATSLQRDDRGASAVEYALLVALIAAVIATAVGLLGTKITGIFTSVTTSI
jgi:pilus assembly protein Flp/PilA